MENIWKRKDNIVIQKTDKCDTRTLKKGDHVTVEAAQDDTQKHIEAVIASVNWLCNKAREQVKNHDHTKLDNIEQFTDGLNKGFDSPEFDEWYKMHYTTERHHLLKHVPEDVNIIDLIEMICDCVCAGKARTGDVYPMEIPAEILQKIVDNTVELLKKHIVVKE